ncbi:hypothetical protein OR263_13205 [Streptomyces sp. NEAU-H22]|uniref:hypothetical protein n=1 Tax=unclassified Streptomyces TaxID=2593676 RepID=UPI002254D28F|nr:MULTISPECIES: hypothetical protein [unclassified Streptomyces]MCX3287645.1 hypothetical protein [Streptomyces sp. NEAU-H22]WMD05027.1 hypothetical protein Q7C01_11710 [Streptomyces sp. FXY-T5]
MAETVPVRCPACRREHRYTAPAYPCLCGAPVAPRLDRDGPATPVSHRVWQDDWVTVRCGSCGRHGEWPRPEVGCACGVVLRVAVVEGRGSTGRAAAGDGSGTAAAQGPDTDQDGTVADQGNQQGPPHRPDQGDRPRDAATVAAEARPARPPFPSVTIRTSRDAVTAAALYLRWLGYRGVRRADQRPPSGIGLAARGVVAQVDPAVHPATLRDVECLWLTAMTESADCLYFSLAGYADDARARADSLGVPLFVLDLTGTPRPVNAPAETLAATGAGQRAP